MARPIGFEPMTTSLEGTCSFNPLNKSYHILLLMLKFCLVLFKLSYFVALTFTASNLRNPLLTITIKS